MRIKDIKKLKQNEFSLYRLMSVKDIMNLCECSKFLAVKMRGCIAAKNEIDRKFITYKMFCEFLKIDI